MLDNIADIHRVDKSEMLGFLEKQPQQLLHQFGLAEESFDLPPIHHVVFSGMGGSSLAAEFMQAGPTLPVPFIVSKGYDLPEWVNEHTLVICASYSGNTEETLAALNRATEKNAQIFIIAHGGTLLECAQNEGFPYAQIPECPQPRTGVFYAYRALIEIFIATGLVAETFLAELESFVEGLTAATAQWVSTVSEKENIAKQIASEMVGKTAIIYGGALTYPAAYKWKIGVNENAKNTAWCNQLPEFNHNEFIGWDSHPVEKPFAVIDLISSFEHERIRERFAVTDKLLSGKRPKALRVEAKGESAVEHVLYLILLGDFASTYLAILNNVDPTPVNLVEQFKKELS